MEQTQNHILTLSSQKQITVTAVKQVITVTDEKIILQLLSGVFLTLSGKNLKLGNFSASTGAFSASGSFFSVKYGQEKTSFVKRILK